MVFRRHHRKVHLLQIISFETTGIQDFSSGTTYYGTVLINIADTCVLN